jgi:hypothetical protein
MYESAICLGHQHSSDFGHWFLEVFPAYAALPTDLLRKSVVVVPEPYHHVFDGFAYLGVRPNQIIAGVNIPIFAKEFYTVDFIICGDLNKFLITKLRARFVESFNLCKEKPAKFLTFNRRNMSRSIGNYEELRTAIRERFPSIPWEDSLNLLTLKEQAVYFDKVKFLFGVHGSVLANIIFMQDDTAVLDLQMEQWLLSFLWLAAYTGKFMVVARDHRIGWRTLTPNIVDIELVLSMVKAGLEAISAI